MDLHPLEKRVLRALTSRMSFDAIVEKSGLKPDQVRRALSGLKFRNLVKEYDTEKEKYFLTELGEKYLKVELPEFRMLALVLEPIPVKDLMGKFERDEFNAAFGKLKKNGYVRVERGNVVITEEGRKYLESKDNQVVLEKLSQGEDIKPPEELIRRGIIGKKTVKYKEFEPTDKVKSLKLDLEDEIQLLTPEMIKTSSWKGKKFRKYDVTLLPEKQDIARRHPVSEVLNILRRIFLEMGFKEMTGPWVDTAFWVMDSMWIPQDHPARDVQDTFYLGMKGDLPDKSLVRKVKMVQENGGNTGSKGHRIKWDPEKARELILRTHTTAETFRKFGIDKIKEGRYFYIGEVFRNETADATHLPEFIQAEGFIMGDDLSLADLMGFVKEFYSKLGITKIRFKPTYNPYTEPSMEAHYYDERLGKWYALINSGIFRPEALAPYGINKTVIAWGMGASPRMVNLIYQKAKLKELVGPEVDIEWLKKHKSPVVKLYGND